MIRDSEVCIPWSSETSFVQNEENQSGVNKHAEGVGLCAECTGLLLPRATMSCCAVELGQSFEETTVVNDRVPNSCVRVSER